MSAKHAISPLAPKPTPTLPRIAGVKLAAAQSGGRYKDRDDVMLVLLPAGATVAGVLTKSKTCSAPVDWCRKNLARGKVRAIIVNAGNANAFTGKLGDKAVEESTRSVAQALGCPRNEVFMASTGVIGQPLEWEKIVAVVPALIKGAREDNWAAASSSIMTTDTFPKLATRQAKIGEAAEPVGGVFKRAAPVAANRSVSLVEVSPSTVTQFSDLSAATVSNFCSTPPGILASVNTKPSIVAMSGAIMPEPFRKPLTVTVFSPILAWRVASLGNVSVVMIDADAAAQLSSRAPLIRAGTTATIFSHSSGWPITPVEAMKTSLSGQPSAWATERVLSSTALSPSLPVKALALPALTMIARTLPRARFLRHQSTGAEQVLDLVSTPETVAPAGRSTSITSSRSL